MICSALYNKHLTLTMAVLPAVMLLASLMVSLAPTTAFAEKDASDNKQSNIDSNRQKDTNQLQTGDRSLTIDPTAQDSVQTGINVAVNPHVITDKESCKEANDHVTQENVQSSDQNARRDVKSGEGSVYVNPTVQTSTQIALNVYVDVDVVLVPGCHPHDHVTQDNVQSSDQNARRDVKSGEGSITDGSTYQKSTQFERNIAVDEEVVMPLPLPK